MLEVRTLPDGQLTERFRLVRDAATACGYGGRFRKLELAVRFDDEWSYGQPDAHDVGRSVRSRNAHGVEQGTCVHCGNCCIGCPVQAKSTLNLNYLARARREGAEIRPLHLVSHVCTLDRGYRVHFERLEDGAAVLGEVTADEVYLGAGSLGTTEILLRSRDVFGTLGRLSERLSQGMDASNGTLLLARRKVPAGGRKLDPDWKPESSRRSADAQAALHRGLSKATGGMHVVPPSWSAARYSISPHPLGRAGMADSAAEGVVDQWGEAFSGTPASSLWTARRYRVPSD